MIKLLITDLDDTLYSWIGFFIPSFYAMAEEVSHIIDVDLSSLLDEYKYIHQEKGNVEYPFATLLLPSVKAAFPTLSRKKIQAILDPAFHRFHSVRKDNLKLFSGVKETLERLVSEGIRIVGYTESAKENGYYRLNRLGIDHLFSSVYVSKSQYRNKKSHILPQKLHVVTGKKPNPLLLKRICADKGTSLNEAVYVGDSLTKDVYMANRAGVFSILIKVPQDSFDMTEYYNKLVAISHWLPEDFEREAALRRECAEKGIVPDVTITNFSDILSIIDNMNRE